MSYAETALAARLQSRSPELERSGITVVIATVTTGFLAADVGSDFEPRSAIYHLPENRKSSVNFLYVYCTKWECYGSQAGHSLKIGLEDAFSDWAVRKGYIH